MSNVNFTYVPEHIAQSDLLSLASKKILEALLNYQFNSKAYDTGKLFINNATLCKLSKVGHSQLMKSIVELKMYSLVDRVQGGERGNASEYIIHFEKLKEPLKRKSFDDMFGRFMKGGQSRETPMGTTITTTITTPITTTRPTTSSTTRPTTRPIESTTTRPIESTTISPTISPIENTNTTLTESPTINETETTNSDDKVEQTVETDKKEELLQFFIETVNLDVERLHDSFFTHFNGIESNTELAKKLIDYVFVKLGKTEYELYRKVCEQIETVFKLEKPKYLVNTNTSTSSKKVDEESSIISETVQDEMPF